MKINVEGISQGVREIQASHTAAQLGFAPSDLEFPGEILILANVTRMGDDVFVKSRIEAAVSHNCCRCLEPYGLAINTGFEVLFVPERPPQSFRRDLRRPIVDDEDGKVSRYRGKVIDLSGEIMNAIRLSLPMKPLCDQNCLGLCPHCGSNRNQESCDCESKQPKGANNPFRELQDKLTGRK